MPSVPLLLDTCAVIYLGRGVRLIPAAQQAIDAAAKARMIFVSVMSAWEIGQAVAKGRLALTLPPLLFFNRFMETSGAAKCSLDAEILVAASALPGPIHKDPIDRMLVSAARSYGYRLVTSDRAILAYGEAGHVRTLAC